MNQRGLDHFRLSLGKITLLGYEFFEKILNSGKINKYNIELEKSFDLSAHFIMMGIFNIKTSEKRQSFTYNPFNVLEYFDNGMPKRILCVAFELKENNYQDGNPMAIILNEINNINVKLNNSNFTRREKQILALIVKGKTDKDISNELFISAETAKKHRHNLIKKSGVNNTAELVSYAKDNIIY